MIHPKVRFTKVMLCKKKEIIIYTCSMELPILIKSFFE